MANAPAAIAGAAAAVKNMAIATIARRRAVAKLVNIPSPEAQRSGNLAQRLFQLGEQVANLRHERDERLFCGYWIAAAQERLAMTGRDFRHPPPPLRANRSNPGATRN